ncbi:hypothetical protein ACLIA0_08845 [Bacillaceae bacterium W0354]
MKKYIKTIVALVVILSCIGTYYVQSAIERHSNPSFSINTIAGDEKYIDDVIIGAFYSNSKNGYYAGGTADFLNLTDDGTFYNVEQSFFDSLKGTKFSLDRAFREKHNGLMRGLYYVDNNAVETDDYIAIVEPNHFYYRSNNQYLNVRYLNKHTNKINKIQYDDIRSNNHLIIEDIQIANDEIIVFTKSWEFNEKDELFEFIEAYHFDVNTNSFKEKHTLFLDEKSGNVNFNKLNESESWKPNEYVVYRKTVEHDGVPESSELLAYHVPTGKIEYLNVEGLNENGPQQSEDHEHGDKMVVDVDRVYQFDGSNLYFRQASEAGQPVIKVFNIKQQKLISELPLDFDPVNDPEPVISVKDGLIYVIERDEYGIKNIELSVYDTTTNEFVYEGEIVIDEKDGKKDSILDIQYLQFKY